MFTLVTFLFSFLSSYPLDTVTKIPGAGLPDSRPLAFYSQLSAVSCIINVGPTALPADCCLHDRNVTGRHFRHICVQDTGNVF